jgi:hypothetical protein
MITTNDFTEAVALLGDSEGPVFYQWMGYH